jgi:3-hydroxybutyryl-CoA dehydrogenase
MKRRNAMHSANEKMPNDNGRSSSEARVNPEECPAAVVGVGLMGRSIIACLLSSGHPVLAVTRNLHKREAILHGVQGLLEEMLQEGLLKADPGRVVRKLEVTDRYGDLADRRVIIESIVEAIEIKKETLRRVEEVVAPGALIGSNTSAIPVTLIQEGALHPERILGIHWAEPAHVTRFMEVICGDRTGPEYAEFAVALARRWGKEPTLVKRDIRGFITNRLMYALLREAFHLVEAGYATHADIDRSMRNDLGYWITFAGPFRFMDLTGIPAYAAVMEDLFPDLDCSKEVPDLMRKVVASGARGVQNARGFYNYTPEQAECWERLFLKYSYEIRALALRYPEDVGNRVLEPVS